MSEWNKLNKVRKGQKGFVRVPEDKKQNKAVMVNLSKSQFDTITEYCKKHKIKKTEFLRESAYNTIKANNPEMLNDDWGSSEDQISFLED